MIPLYPLSDSVSIPKRISQELEMPGRASFPASGFGVRLKAVREESGLTQKQIGDSAGVHPNTIAKLERGEQEPAWPIVLALAEALGVEVTAFVPEKSAAKKTKGK